jgi:homoserine kinase
MAIPFSQLKPLGSEKGIPGKQRRTIVAQLLAQQLEQISKPAVSTARGASSSVASAAAGLALADQTFEEVCQSAMC